MVHVANMQPSRAGWTGLASVATANVEAKKPGVFDEAQPHSNSRAGKIMRRVSAGFFIALIVLLAVQSFRGAGSGANSGAAWAFGNFTMVNGVPAAAWVIFGLGVVAAIAVPLISRHRRRAADREWGAIAAAARAAGARADV